MRVLGIDPGFGRMGFGCVEIKKGKVDFLGAGVLTTPASLSLGKRLLSLEEDLTDLLREYKPDRIGMEKLFFTKNAKTALSVAESLGIARLCAARAGIPVVERTPSQIKKALTGDGRADKRAVQQMVKRLLNLSRAPRPDDAADALAAALSAS